MNIYIVAGEKSGDIHGSLMLRHLTEMLPQARIQGLGGESMHALCPEIENWADEAAVIGFVEVIKKYGWFRKRFLELLSKIEKDQPDCLILIDYPGFNLRMANKVRQVSPHTKIIYFISPQVWAWHRGRIPKMAQTLDYMMCIFPFEAPLFQDAGLPTKFVGHPLVDEIKDLKIHCQRDAQLIGLFPGSRNREIDRHFPVLLEVIREMSKTQSDVKFETAASNQKLADRMKDMAIKARIPLEVVNITIGRYHELMDRACVGVVASGTATMEAALHGMPYMLVYKVPALTYLMAKMLVKIPHIGMVNILAQREVVKELIQNDFTPEQVIAEIERLMCPLERQKLSDEMKAAADLLGEGGAAKVAAETIVTVLQGA